MLCIPKIDDYLKILTDEEVTLDEVEKYVQSISSDNCIHCYNV